jgi:hypothetical protein
MTDYSALRAQTIGSTQEEEAVTVNTRALVRIYPCILHVFAAPKTDSQI